MVTKKLLNTKIKKKHVLICRPEAKLISKLKDFIKIQKNCFYFITHKYCTAKNEKTYSKSVDFKEKLSKILRIRKIFRKATADCNQITSKLSQFMQNRRIKIEFCK